MFFPPFGQRAYMAVSWSDLFNLTETRLIENVLNYLTYFFLFLWIPVIFFIHILFLNKNHFSKIATEQSPYNLLDRRIENELMPMCEYYGLGLITWAPLAMGVLAGRYKKNEQNPKNSRAILRGGFYADRVNERGIDAGLKLNKIAINLGLTSAQLAVLWVKHQKGVTAPLIGPRTIKQLKEFIKIIDTSIDESVCELCDQIVPPGSAVADFHNTAPWMKMRI